MKEKTSENRDSHVRMMSRRGVLKLGLLAVAAGVFPRRAFASADNLLLQDRTISVYNLHTKEYLSTVYWQNGAYLPEAIDQINHIFRDHYNGRIRPIDPELIDLLFAIQQDVGCDEPFHLISGYRSRQTNNLLRQHSSKVARRSLHIKGKAADIRLPGLNLKTLRHTAYELRRGGVGFYPGANFIHIDVGRVRFWRG